MIFRLRQGLEVGAVDDDVGLRIGLLQAAKLKEIEWGDQNQQRRSQQHKQKKEWGDQNQQRQSQQHQQRHADQVQHFSDPQAKRRSLLVGQSDAARGFF